MKKFETGKTYTGTTYGETRDFTYRFEIIKRTKKTVTYIETDWTGEKKDAATKRIIVRGDAERFMPHGPEWYKIEISA